MKLAGEIVKPAWAPVPVTGIVSGEFPALLTMLIEPLTAPTAVGANFAVSVAVSEGFSVVGVVTPLIVKPAPAADTLEILTAAVPVFVNTTCLSADVPVAMVPKLRLVGLALNWPVGVELPVPLRGTATVGFVESLLVMLRLPVALPLAVGEKVTATCAD